jgi:hypothetical protein
MEFFDYFKRKIQIGDVLANAHRARSTAQLSLAIVRGFTEQSILVSVLERGYLSGKSWIRSETGHVFRFRDIRSYTLGERCFITGLTEQDLYKLIIPTIQKGKSPCVS